MSRKTAALQRFDTDFHVYNRGVDKQTIFFRPADYNLFLSLMESSLNNDLVSLLVYCLMPNHFHLIIRQFKPYAISDFMKAVCETFAKTINQRRKRCGHLFGSRFKIAPLSDPATLLRTSHYVHSNPVSAGLSASPSAWLYSSYTEYVSTNLIGFVHTERILDAMRSTHNSWKNSILPGPSLYESSFHLRQQHHAPAFSSADIFHLT